MQLVSINIGKVRSLQLSRQTMVSGIHKQPVTEGVWISKLGLAGDEIADPKHHGGPDQAVYVYSSRDYEWWSHELGRRLGPGTFGENLTLSEFVFEQARIGDQLDFGTVVLELTCPRIPCQKLANWIDEPDFAKRFRNAVRPGVYCRVLKEGLLQPGDRGRHEPYSGPTIEVGDVFHAYYDRDLSVDQLKQLLTAPLAIRARQDFERRLETFSTPSD